MSGRFGSFPEAIMRRKRTVAGANRTQAPVEQRKVDRLVGANADPVVDESAGKECAKASGHVECEIDRAEFDVRQRMKHGGPAPLGPALPSLRHSRCGKELRTLRAGRSIRHCHIEEMLQPVGAPRPRRSPSDTHFVARFGCKKNRARGLGNRGPLCHGLVPRAGSVRVEASE